MPPLLVVNPAPDHEMQALSTVVFLLDACILAVAVVVAFQLVIGRSSDRTVIYGNGVVVGTASTMICRAAISVPDSVIEQWTPIVSLALVAAGVLARGPRHIDPPEDDGTEPPSSDVPERRSS